jgi:hypothetical protein
MFIFPHFGLSSANDAVPDPDPAYHFDADLDPDPAYQLDADLDPTFHFQIKAQNLEKMLK